MDQEGQEGQEEEEGGAMFVFVKDKYGTVKEFYCDHSLLHEYKGRQRPLAKFLTTGKVRQLEAAVPAGALTSYDKTGDKRHYRYRKEPDGGDFFKRFTTSNGVEVTESDEEFVVDVPKDGRWFACELLFDFIKKYGRPAKTGDVTTSQAWITVARF